MVKVKEESRWIKSKWYMNQLFDLGSTITQVKVPKHVAQWGIIYHWSKVSKMIQWSFINIFETKKIESTSSPYMDDLKCRSIDQVSQQLKSKASSVSKVKQKYE